MSVVKVEGEMREIFKAPMPIEMLLNGKVDPKKMENPKYAFNLLNSISQVRDGMFDPAGKQIETLVRRGFFNQKFNYNVLGEPVLQLPSKKQEIRQRSLDIVSAGLRITIIADAHPFNSYKPDANCRDHYTKHFLSQVIRANSRLIASPDDLKKVFEPLLSSDDGKIPEETRQIQPIKQINLSDDVFLSPDTESISRVDVIKPLKQPYADIAKCMLDRLTEELFPDSIQPEKTIKSRITETLYQFSNRK
jgi:hypothetical protein